MKHDCKDQIAAQLLIIELILAARSPLMDGAGGMDVGTEHDAGLRRERPWLYASVGFVLQTYNAVLISSRIASFAISMPFPSGI